jgi:hypothetical protein
VVRTESRQPRHGHERHFLHEIAGVHLAPNGLGQLPTRPPSQRGEIVDEYLLEIGVSVAFGRGRC